MIIKEYKIKYTRKEKVNTSIKFNGMNNDLFTLSDKKNNNTTETKTSFGCNFLVLYLPNIFFYFMVMRSKAQIQDKSCG